MPIQPTVFAQIMALLDHDELNRCIERYEGNARVKSFTCLDQFLCLVFAQFAEKRSLSATVFTLSRMRQKLYHMGIRGNVVKSTLADANQSRNWRIWRDYANSLMARSRLLHSEVLIQVDEDIQSAVYAFDSSTVDLCLSVFEWAHFRRTKAGIKLHTQLDLRGDLPVWLDINEALGSDVKALDNLPIEPDSFYLMDRGYLDFSRLYKFTIMKAFFVTRAKDNTRFRRVYSSPVEKSTGLICDQIGSLETKKAALHILKSCAV
jgi:Domain of unknown function (DUF4372)/Transposase DDE domain